MKLRDIMQERIFVLADPDHGKSLPVYERYYIYSEFDSRNQETFTSYTQYHYLYKQNVAGDKISAIYLLL